MKSSLTTIIVGVISVIGLTLAAIIGIAVATDPGEGTSLYAAVIGLGAATIPAIVALAKIDSVSGHVEEVKTDLKNGLLKNNLKAALEQDEDGVFHDAVANALRTVLAEPINKENHNG